MLWALYTNLIVSVVVLGSTLKPGVFFRYSNLGYCALGLIVQRVWSDHKNTAFSYGETVRGLLLDRAGISKNEMYLGADAPRMQEARAECGDTCGPDGEWPGAWNRGQMGRMEAHGGWVARPEALMKLVRATTRPYCQHTGCILSARSMEALTARPEVAGSSATQWYGLGWKVNKWGNSWHTGGMPGTSSLLVRTSSGFAWALAFNTRGFQGNMDQLMWDAVKCANWQ